MNARLDLLAPPPGPSLPSPAAPVLCCPRYSPATDAAPALIADAVIALEAGATRLGPLLRAALRLAGQARL